MQDYKMLVFDFDGVLSNSLAVCIEELNALRKFFPTIPNVISKLDMTLVYGGKLKDSLLRFGLTQEQTADFFHRHANMMLKRASDVYPFHEVLLTVQKTKINKAIVTSSMNDAVIHVLQKTGLSIDQLGWLLPRRK